jgi:hypothetical protein
MALSEKYGKTMENPQFQWIGIIFPVKVVIWKYTFSDKAMCIGPA